MYRQFMKPFNRVLLSKYSIYSCDFPKFYCKTLLNTKDQLKFDYDFLCAPENQSYIKTLIHLRKGIGDIEKVTDLYRKLKSDAFSEEDKERLEAELEKAAALIPNDASPHLFEYGEDPKLLEYVNDKPKFSYKPKELHDLGRELDILQTDDIRLRHLAGFRSYYFRGALADLEQALIRYTVSNLLKRGFVLMSVPDLLYADVIESCGMDTKRHPPQVYRIDGLKDDVCLSGTAEMAIGGYLRNMRFSLKDLPLKLAAVSRCYRAETSSTSEENLGVYRVHNFTKVEMFGVTATESGKESDVLYTELIEIQKELFTQLGIHFQILDMPLSDLGAPAYCKVDMEAWMPGKNLYGEISSSSNCTTYQSRRLNITYKDNEGVQKFVHTVNGTACAVPRMLIALCETFQTENEGIAIPLVLQPYINGLKNIKIDDSIPCQLTPIRRKMYDGKIL